MYSNQIFISICLLVKLKQPVHMFSQYKFIVYTKTKFLLTFDFITIETDEKNFIEQNTGSFACE